MMAGGEPHEAEEGRDPRAEELPDPLFLTVDVIVYTAILAVPALLMLFFGPLWAIACLAALVVAACGSGRIARAIVDALRRWLGR